MTASERPASPPFRDAEHDASGEPRCTRERTPLRVLIVEDSENDVMLLLSNLKRGGYEPLHEWVETPEKMEEALGRGPWDVVVADQGMPLFSATDALALLREKGLDLPFVLVSDKIGEDEAVALRKNGEGDYSAQDAPARLGPVIERELREAEYQRKKWSAEEAHGEAEARYRSIFENAAEGLFRSTADGRLQAANPALARILGYASADGLVSSVADIGRLIPADPARREEFAEQMRRYGGVVGFEARALRKDGSTIWSSLNVTSVYNGAGEVVGFEGFVEDITERKQAEEALKESEQWFRSLVQHSSEVITVLEPDGTIRYESPGVEKVLGYRPEELIGQNVFDHIHPDDLGRLSKVIAEVSKGPGGPLTAEFRSRHSDGSWHHLEAVVDTLMTASGAGEMVMNSRDVTERKRTEEAQRQSEALYRTVVEQAAENIFLIDYETRRVLEANPAFHRALDYTTEELRGLTLYDIVAEDRESVDRNIRLVAKEKAYFIGERKYRRKDGSPMYVEVSASTIHYRGKKAICVVSHDITLYRRTEESLRHSLDVLLALREAGQILGSTLEPEEIWSRLLEIMRSVSGLTAAVISREDERGRLRVWREAGIGRLWDGAPYASEAEVARRAAFETGEKRLFWLQGPDPETWPLAGLCLPLRTRERIAGVLEAYGPEYIAEEDTVAMLDSLAAQSASVLENARLYGELAQREKRLEDLVGKLFAAQEEERRRVAYEVHDGLAQIAAAAHQHLQAFARLYPPAPEGARDLLDQAQGWVQRTVGEARRVIADLRPTALDDFGLQTALRLEAEALREEGRRVGYEENLGDERLPVAVETALFRVAQEALRNVRKHATTERVRFSLVRSKRGVRVSVRDWGQGFDAEDTYPAGSPGERVGLSSMRERVVLLGGDFRVDSRPGVGTLITANVPLPGQREANLERADLG